MKSSTSGERVVVLGASDNPERYSNKAIKMLREKGHEVLPVHPKLAEIEGLKCFSTLAAVSAEMKAAGKGPVDTLTVYVGPQHQSPLISEIISLRPRRVILNPGTEGEELKTALAAAAIPFLEACTLVLLQTKQF